ncbi:RNA polymerase sigma factor [uncultured Caulobacter sp.]|jgi:RNA polymerase sigma factor (sigma-70 family)|uniref:RNA polymerase sigma factor n=1 Tax=uncultured Caulobacter sp. TaxID=158749 RepID=UPI002616F343|nr:RNA polymerase sigma factor [uncultured Caulobacter sp.]
MGTQSPPTGHDVELAALSAAGDRRAYGELVRRHGSAVRGLLRRLGADSATADDLAQDAFMTGFEQAAEFRGEGTFAAWIKTIAARLYLKKVKREARLIFSDTVEPVEAVMVGEASRDAASRIDLDEALKTLSRGERLCVSLCYGADWSHAEAAEALNIPIGTVKSHVKRGLDKLRARLARPEEGARREAHG